MNETFSLLTFIISVIVLIVFFIMAGRLKKIEENTNQAGYGFKVRQFYEARSQELAGDKNEALKNYYQLLWRHSGDLERAGITKKKKKKKIQVLGGDPDIKPTDFN